MSEAKQSYFIKSADRRGFLTPPFYLAGQECPAYRRPKTRKLKPPNNDIQSTLLQHSTKPVPPIFIKHLILLEHTDETHPLQAPYSVAFVQIFPTLKYPLSSYSLYFLPAALPLDMGQYHLENLYAASH